MGLLLLLLFYSEVLYLFLSTLWDIVFKPLGLATEDVVLIFLVDL